MTRAIVALAVLAGASSTGWSYSVLTHEAIVDSTWDTGIRPLLLKRFPTSTEEELVKAHAYAYGGSIIQDLGYYPFGSKFYSDLTHYVRSGDYIVALIAESQDLNEYAFALGALSHYAADNSGHAIAVNVTVPLFFPKLREKYGEIVTYADDPGAHGKTEFGFDVFQASRGRYAPGAYKDFIGFEVAKPVMERAFEKTYCMKLEQVFFNVDLAIGSYRRAVGTVLPALTKVAWQINKQKLESEVPGITRQKFIYNLSRASYNRTYGTHYQKPGVASRILAFFIRIVPKVGPLAPFKFKQMTPKAEQFYMASVNTTIERYRRFLADVGAGRLVLPNENIDTGDPTIPGKYILTDAAYAKLLHKLADHLPEASKDLRKDILAFYRDLSLPIATKKDPEEWYRVMDELNRLKASDLTAQSRKE
jgi:hypothetical protein